MKEIYILMYYSKDSVIGIKYHEAFKNKTNAYKRSEELQKKHKKNPWFDCDIFAVNCMD